MPNLIFSPLPFARKLKLFLNYFLGPLLFAGIVFSIYRQLVAQPQIQQHWLHIREVINGPNKYLLIITVLLMFINWGIESKKWQLLTSHIQPISYSRAIRSVMAGVSFTMLTPNRMGEFLGRVLYLPDGSRIRAAMLTMLSSLSQVVVTLFAGLIGLLLLKKWAPQLKAESEGWSYLLVNGLVFGTGIVIVIGILVYFNIGWFIRQIEKIPPISKYAFYIHLIGEIHYTELLKLLGLSILRYLVFLAQYSLVFNFFEVNIAFPQLLATTAVMFLMLAIIPTIALAELGIRGKISLFVFGLFTANSLEILVATAVVWFINIIFPAIAGSFLLLSVKLFRKT